MSEHGDNGDLPRLDAAALRGFPPLAAGEGCAICGGLRCVGWESVTAPFGRPGFVAAGTLRDPELAEPTYAEYHPRGSSFWSAEAPIAPAFFPFNRCEVWRCAACGRGLLQYTEAGGYYVDHRARLLDPARVEEPAAPGV